MAYFRAQLRQVARDRSGAQPLPTGDPDCRYTRGLVKRAPPCFAVRFIIVKMKIASIALGIVAASSVHAQLVFGSTYYASAAVGVSGAFYLDVDTGMAQQIWIGASNKKVSALAADPITRTIWGADNARLTKWAWGSVGTAPIEVSGYYRLGSNGTAYATFVGSLAFANGKLYAYTNYNAGGSALFVEDGIYEIDPTVPRPGPNMNLVWRHDDLAYNFEGFDYSPETGLFYATNNVSDPLRSLERGIYSIDLFGAGAITKIANYSAYLPSPDGLAVGRGKLWLTQKATDWTALKIEAFDLATQQFGARFELEGFSSTSRFTGATWFDRPTTTVSGRLTLGDFVGTRAFPAATFELTPIGGGTPTSIADVVIAPDGTYQFESTVIRPQRVTVRAKGFLRRTLSTSVVFSGAAVTALDGTLVSADIDGDNAVTVFDYDILSTYFDASESDANWTTIGGNGFAPRDADLDGDNAVTVFDYDVLSRNFDLTGDAA